MDKYLCYLCILVENIVGLYMINIRLSWYRLGIGGCRVSMCWLMVVGSIRLDNFGHIDYHLIDNTQHHN